MSERENFLRLHMKLVLLLRYGEARFELGLVALHAVLGVDHRQIPGGYLGQFLPRDVRRLLEPHPSQDLPLDHLQVPDLDLLPHLAAAAARLLRGLGVELLRLVGAVLEVPLLYTVR